MKKIFLFGIMVVLLAISVTAIETPTLTEPSGSHYTTSVPIEWGFVTNATAYEIQYYYGIWNTLLISNNSVHSDQTTEQFLYASKGGTAGEWKGGDCESFLNNQIVCVGDVDGYVGNPPIAVEVYNKTTNMTDYIQVNATEGEGWSRNYNYPKIYVEDSTIYVFLGGNFDTGNKNMSLWKYDSNLDEIMHTYLDYGEGNDYIHFVGDGAGNLFLVWKNETGDDYMYGAVVNLTFDEIISPTIIYNGSSGANLAISDVDYFNGSWYLSFKNESDIREIGTHFVYELNSSLGVVNSYNMGKTGGTLRLDFLPDGTIASTQGYEASTSDNIESKILNPNFTIKYNVSCGFQRHCVQDIENFGDIMFVQAGRCSDGDIYFCMFDKFGNVISTHQHAQTREAERRVAEIAVADDYVTLLYMDTYDWTRFRYYNVNTTYTWDVSAEPYGTYKVRVRARENFGSYYNSSWIESGEFQICVANWTCGLYGDCNTSDLRPCIEAEDLNNCSLNFTGNVSDFAPQACDYCTPDWSCTRYQSVCPPYHIKSCLAVTDSNGCYLLTGLPSDDFDGNYSAYETTCGYNSTYDTEDLREESVDAIGAGLIELVHWVRVIIILWAIVSIGYSVGKWGIEGLVKKIRR